MEGAEDRGGRKEELQGSTRKILNMMEIFVVLIMVTVSLVRASVKIHQVVHLCAMYYTSIRPQ